MKGTSKLDSTGNSAVVGAKKVDAKQVGAKNVGAQNCKVALVGFGTVGSSVARILCERSNTHLRLTHVLNRNVARKMHRVRFHQPDVPVNPRPLVKPAVTRGGIHTNQEHVSSTGGRKVGHIEGERIVSAAVPADVEAVEDHHRSRYEPSNSIVIRLPASVPGSSKTRRYHPTLVAGYVRPKG